MRLSLACLAASVARTVSRRAQRGIYAGKDVRSGNKVSEDGGNRSRRTWKPNVQQKSLWFAPLQRHLRLSVTTSALRRIDKAGGLENYLLSSQPAKLDARAQELRGWLLGWRAAAASRGTAMEASSEGVAAAGGGGGGAEGGEGTSAKEVKR